MLVDGEYALEVAVVFPNPLHMLIHLSRWLSEKTATNSNKLSTMGESSMLPFNLRKRGKKIMQLHTYMVVIMVDRVWPVLREQRHGLCNNAKQHINAAATAPTTAYRVSGTRGQAISRAGRQIIATATTSVARRGDVLLGHDFRQHLNRRHGTPTPSIQTFYSTYHTAGHTNDTTYGKRSRFLLPFQLLWTVSGPHRMICAVQSALS